MATTRQTKTKPAGTAVANYDEEMARYAAQYSKQEENSGGIPYFSVKGATLMFAGSPVPDNRMACVIVDVLIEHAYYPGRYDPDNPEPPSCFAFGRDETAMEPHRVCVEAGTAQNDICGMDRQEGCCPMNEFGSADTGRGKACKNTRRLALLPVPGEFDANGKFTIDHDELPNWLENSSFGFFRPGVTSVKAFSNYIKQAGEAMKLPPFGLITKVEIKPDASNQYTVEVKAIDKLPRELTPIVIKRLQEVKPIIETPYPPAAAEGRQKPAARGRGPAPKAAPRGRGR